MPDTPDDLDIVQVLKQEWSSLGGGEGSDLPYSVPLTAVQDALEGAGLFVVEIGRRNKAVAIWAYNGNLKFRDVANPGTDGKGYTLSDLIAGTGGLTEGTHEVLDTLVHQLAENLHIQLTRSGGRVSNVTAWTDGTETTKVREIQVTRTAGKISQVVAIQYDGTGVEKSRLTYTVTRVSGKVDSIDVVETEA